MSQCIAEFDDKVMSSSTRCAVLRALGLPPAPAIDAKGAKLAPRGYDFKGGRQPLDPHATQSSQKSSKGLGIGGIEGAADRQLAQRGVINHKSDRVVAIELVGDFSQRPSLAHDFVLEPGH